METKEIFGNAETAVKKTTAKAASKASTAKTTAKKVAKEAKETVKKTATKVAKTTAKKDVKRTVFIQYFDKQIDEEALVKKVNAELKAQKVTVTDLKLYIKPEDNACYYVANGKVAGQVSLF